MWLGVNRTVEELATMEEDAEDTFDAAHQVRGFHQHGGHGCKVCGGEGGQCLVTACIRCAFISILRYECAAYIILSATMHCIHDHAVRPAGAFAANYFQHSRVNCAGP